MVIENFSFARFPKIYFGPGEFRRINEIIRQTGKTVLLVTGSRSFRSSDRWTGLLASLKQDSVCFFDYALSGEPSPEQVDEAVNVFGEKEIDLVIAIGGGSVIDGGKAISAMLPHRSPVKDYLEGVGTKKHNGEKVPFAAVPTTAGTGSEATKNAVLSRTGDNGFKKSLRHDNFVPDTAVIDPELTLACPADVTASCGMDAFTQLLESYVSTQASPITDALAFSGIKHAKDARVPAATGGAGDIGVRSGMSYAALISGITLANAGLGIVHGIASSIGGYFDIPHGVFCGTMIGDATEMNINKLNDDSSGLAALDKYAKIGYLLTESRGYDIEQGCKLLVKKLHEWTDLLNLPRLSKFGIRETDLDRIIDSSGLKNNPAPLNRDDMKQLLLKRL
jgi:alcohol dehydrogenase class IV